VIHDPVECNKIERKVEKTVRNGTSRKLISRRLQKKKNRRESGDFIVKQVEQHNLEEEMVFEY